MITFLILAIIFLATSDTAMYLRRRIARKHEATVKRISDYTR